MVVNALAGTYLWWSGERVQPLASVAAYAAIFALLYDWLVLGPNEQFTTTDAAVCVGLAVAYKKVS